MSREAPRPHDAAPQVPGLGLAPAAVGGPFPEPPGDRGDDAGEHDAATPPPTDPATAAGSPAAVAGGPSPSPRPLAGFGEFAGGGASGRSAAKPTAARKPDLRRRQVRDADGFTAGELAELRAQYEEDGKSVAFLERVYTKATTTDAADALAQLEADLAILALSIRMDGVKPPAGSELLTELAPARVAVNNAKQAVAALGRQAKGLLNLYARLRSAARGRVPAQAAQWDAERRAAVPAPPPPTKSELARRASLC